MVRHALLFFFGLAAACAALRCQDDPYAEDLQQAEQYLVKGKIERARSLFEDVLSAVEEEAEEDRPSRTDLGRARLGLLRIELRRGQYAAVVSTIGKLGQEERNDREHAILFARSLARLGRVPEAITVLERLVKNSPGDIEGAFCLGLLQRYLGHKAVARKIWQAAIQEQVRVPTEDPQVTTWLARCRIELGGRPNVETASAELTLSIRKAPERPEALLAYAQLEFEVYREASGFPSGERHFKRVLEQNGEVERALLGLYRLRKSNFHLNPAATERYLARALAANPHSVPAMMERAIVLLDDRRFEEAAQLLDRALEINPKDKWVLAHRTAAALLMNRSEQAARMRARALAVDPSFDELDRVIGDHLVALYRFADSVPYYRKCLAASPDSVPALHGLAKALIYMGQGEEARSLLEKAKKLQPGFVNPWRNNALAIQSLLAEEYVTQKGGGFSMRLQRDDAGVLRRYLLPTFEQARAVLGRKYGYLPDYPVTVEVLHTWDDFSVRTIGFRGFSALGACFGRMITLVSPSDKDLRRQDFMWAATVWHEYAHVITLALSRGRVPRWLTEGFSVHEERSRNMAWERGMDRELFDAYHNGEIVPLRGLNRLFRGPRILFGYYEGGLIVDYLSRQYGFAKVVEFLKGYGEDRAEEELFAQTFGIGTKEFDRRFLAHLVKSKIAHLRLVPRLNDRTLDRLQERLVDAPNDHESRIRLGWAYLQRDDPLDAAQQLRVVLAKQPGDGAALLLHAELLRRRKAYDKAVSAYRAGFKTGSEDFDSRVHFGKLLQARGDTEGALEQFQLAKRCWPGCTDQSVAPALLLARLLRKLGRETEALMELKAYCKLTGRAFKPRLELAQLERDAGHRKNEARYLREALQIDPFVRSVHVRLADADVELKRLDEAVTELEAALAVPPDLDRDHVLQREPQIPAADSPQERAARAAICIKLARIEHARGKSKAAESWLTRASENDPQGPAATQAHELRQRWRR